MAFPSVSFRWPSLPVIVFTSIILSSCGSSSTCIQKNTIKTACMVVHAQVRQKRLRLGAAAGLDLGDPTCHQASSGLSCKRLLRPWRKGCSPQSSKILHVVDSQWHHPRADCNSDMQQEVAASGSCCVNCCSSSPSNTVISQLEVQVRQLSFSKLPNHDRLIRSDL